MIAKIRQKKKSLFLIVILGFFTLFTCYYVIDQSLNFSLVNGDSMNPNLKNGDIVISKPVNILEIGLLDIVIYKPLNWKIPFFWDQQIIHRIINITIKDNIIQYQAKGDNNFLIDPEYIPFYLIQGKVIFCFSFLYQIISFIILANVISLLLYYDLIYKKKKRVS